MLNQSNTIDCPVCGESSAKAVVHKESNFDPGQLDAFSFASRKFPEYMSHRYLRCGRCHLLYVSPLPDLDGLQQLYAEADFDSGEESNWAARTYHQVLEAAAHLVDRDGVLDIGASNGAFLRCLKDAGFTGLIGVEPSRKPIESAAADVRNLLLHDIFRRDLFAPESFSLVTCFQTLEHLPDPLAMAKDVLTVLKPGGVFYIVSHDYSSPANRILGEKSPIYDIEHLQIFCPDAIRALLGRAGYAGVDIRPVYNRYPLAYWIRLAPLANTAKIRLIRLVQESWLRNVAVALPVGNMAVFATKG